MVSHILVHILINLDVTTSNSDHDVIFVIVLLHVESFGTDQVKIILDVNDWNGDVQFLDPI